MDANLLETRRAEALALFSANQRGRVVALALTVGAFASIAAATVIGIALDNDAAAIPLPPLVLFLLALSFEQYADLTVVGEARAVLERSIASELGAAGLIYETAIAPLRKRPPLVTSVRVVQAVGVLIVVLTIGVATVVAYDGQPTRVTLAYSVVTLGCLVAAVLAYRDMLRAPQVARSALRV